MTIKEIAEKNNCTEEVILMFFDLFKKIIEEILEDKND